MSTDLSASLSLRLRPETRDRIATIARATRRSQGDVVREILDRDLGKLEWELRITERVAAHRNGQAKAVTSDELDREMGWDGPPAPDALDWVE